MVYREPVQCRYQNRCPIIQLCLGTKNCTQAEKAVHADGQGPGAVEDAGYLVTFLTSASGVDSRMVVYDARTMAPRPVASVRLPARVPAGFHGLHINEEQLASQLP